MLHLIFIVSTIQSELKKGRVCAPIETFLPLAHVCDAIEYFVVLLYAGYRLVTYGSRAFFPLTPLCPAFVLIAMELCI